MVLRQVSADTFSLSSHQPRHRTSSPQHFISTITRTTTGISEPCCRSSNVCSKRHLEFYMVERHTTRLIAYTVAFCASQPAETTSNSVGVADITNAVFRKHKISMDLVDITPVHNNNDNFETCWHARRVRWLLAAVRQRASHGCRLT